MQNAIDKPTKLALTFKAWKQRLFENKWCSNTCRQTTWYSKGFILCKHDFYCILLTSLVNIHLMYYVCLIICPPRWPMCTTKSSTLSNLFLIMEKNVTKKWVGVFEQIVGISIHSSKERWITIHIFGGRRMVSEQIKLSSWGTTVLFLIF